MKKYILMLVGLVGASVLGGVGVLYAMFNSAPITITKQTPASAELAPAEFAGNVPMTTVTVR